MKDKVVETLFMDVFNQGNPLLLESGAMISDVRVAYETFGELNEDKSNAILICHALSGDAHVAFTHKDDPNYSGWWNFHVGSGKTIDTDKYYVICSNVLGGCKGTTGPGSINPKTNKNYGMDFPVITIADMVNVQKALIDKLNIPKLKAVVGGSMGGMQTMEWCIKYPNMMDLAIVIASTARLTPQALAFDAVARNAILNDSYWNKGDYYGEKKQPEIGLSIARMIGHITYLSHESMNIKFGRNLQEKEDYGYDFGTDFQVESYLKYQGEKFVIRFDANSYLYLTKAISYFDLAKKYGSLKKAFANIQAKLLFIAISSDWLYPPHQSKDIVKALMNLQKDVTYFESDSVFGHDAFLLPDEKISDVIRSFLDKR